MSTASVARLTARSLKGITTEVMQVTPDMASKILAANRHNRRIKRAKVDQLARAMTASEFYFNGEPVQIAKGGLLLNGQHRLHAVVESGCTVPLLIIRGLDHEAQDTIDVGTKRSNTDILQLHGETNASSLASIARRAQMWDQGIKTNSGGRYVPSELEVRRYIEHHGSIHAAVEVAIKGRTRVAIPPSVLGLAFYVCSRVDHMAAKEFYVDQVINGIGLFPGDPAMAFRNILASQSEKRAGRIAETDVLGYLLRAWNLYRNGERAAKLQAPKGGWNASNIPDPH